MDTLHLKSYVFKWISFDLFGTQLKKTRMTIYLAWQTIRPGFIHLNLMDELTRDTMFNGTCDQADFLGVLSVCVILLSLLSFYMWNSQSLISPLSVWF